MPQGLSVSRVVDVTVNFTPQAIPTVRFDTLLILGDSPVVDTGEVMREYNDIADVAYDFGTVATEYLAAALFFGQVPQPGTLFIGRWANTATNGRLVSGPLSLAQQQMPLWTSLPTTAGFTVTLDGGTAIQVTGMNFSGAQNLNAVAATIQAAVRTAGGVPAQLATFTWGGLNNPVFMLTSGTSGANSAISYLTAPTTGTDISGAGTFTGTPPVQTMGGLLMTAPLASRNVPGIALETPVACVARVDGRGWYACTFAASRILTNAEHQAVSGYIEAAADKHMYGITSQDPLCLNAASTADIGSLSMLAGYMRTVVQYSSQRFAIASFFGRALTTNFEGSNTTITMKFKTEPGIFPEVLSGTQATTLANKRLNVYVQYNNGAAILEEGVMSGRAYFDEMHGLDWLANQIQNDLWNVLYTSPKVPQTNPGVHTLVTTCDLSLSQGVTNGLVAPGVWNAPGFGELNQGDTLHAGWYTFANSVDTQDQADREARIAPVITIAVKMAGAIHFANVLVNVNRILLAAIGLGTMLQMLFGGGGIV
jgi:hypothetical protein